MMPSMAGLLSLERREDVAVVTLQRPEKRNALSIALRVELTEAFGALGDDPDVGAVVLTGAGRGFCAGGDVKAMAEGTELGGTTMEEKAQALRSRMETSRWLHEMPKPTIAMLRGPAAGAGLSLAMACDMRVASDTARRGTAFARVGYSGDFGGSYYLTQLVGTADMGEMLRTLGFVLLPVAGTWRRSLSLGQRPNPGALVGPAVMDSRTRRARWNTGVVRKKSGRWPEPM